MPLIPLLGGSLLPLLFIRDLVVRRASFLLPLVVVVMVLGLGLHFRPLHAQLLRNLATALLVGLVAYVWPSLSGTVL